MQEKRTDPYSPLQWQAGTGANALASMVNCDLAGVIALIAARQLIADGLHKMRQLAADPAHRSSITMDAAVDECLFAPPTVLHQAKTSGEVGGCPFSKGSLYP